MNPSKKLSLKNWIIRHLGKLLIPFLPRHSVARRLVLFRMYKRLRPLSEYIVVTRSVCCAILDFPPDTDLLILGTSHTRCGLLPRFFKTKRVKNGSIDDCDWRTAYYKYPHFRKRWSAKPNQTVIVCEDFWLNANLLEFSPHVYIPTVLKFLIGLPYRWKFGTRRFEKIVRPLLPQCVREAHVQFQEESARPDTPPSHDVRGETELDAKEKAASHTKLAGKPSTEIIWGERLLQAIRDDGRIPVLLRPPYHSAYRDSIEQKTSWECLWAPFRKINENVCCLDYTSLQYPDNYWYDADHLNELGAAEWTRRVEKDLADTKLL